MGPLSVSASGEAATPTPRCPHLDWAESGAMALTGHEHGPPLLPPAGLMRLLHELRRALPVDLDPALLLGARAGAAGLTRRGRTSAGGATRLLPAADGWCAVTLARPDDLELLPAILGRADIHDPWDDLAATARTTKARELTAHIRMFGVPAAALPTRPPPPLTEGPPFRTTRIADPAKKPRLDRPLVVDLSSLWAGPLCAHLLGRAGARIVKVESTRRPDGARAGSPALYDWLHGGHESVAVDFTTAEGRADLAELIDAADVVIEASRPRALAQLGLAVERLEHRAGKVWVGITGYGRSHPDRVAFGDDAAVAGGLVARSQDGPVFCGDAIADPLTGVVAALGAFTALARGGGEFIDVSMRDVAAAFAGTPEAEHGPHPVRRDGDGWSVTCPLLGRTRPVLPPRPPAPEAPAPAMGADNALIRALRAPR
ncbi:CoA transferase [Streptomyces sp. NPDC046909]|uniref:CoA transferase n=1 Tax=Streptomyces sp. NPDC046909 TaxID=3155617 RepID=UPI0033CE0EB6